MKIEKGYYRISQYKTFDECFNIKDLPIIYNTIELYALNKDGEVLHKIQNSGWFCMDNMIYPRLYAEKFLIVYELSKYVTRVEISADEYINKTISKDGTINLTFTTETKLFDGEQ